MSTVRRTAKTTGGNTFTGDQILGSETASRAVILNGSKKLTSSSVTDTELGYVSGVTSAIQTQLNGKVSDTGDTMSGQLNFSGTNHAGIKLLSLTTAERDALTPENGMVIYNSTTSKLNGYISGAWTVLADSTGFVQKTGDTMSGNLVMGGNTISGAVFSGKTLTLSQSPGEICMLCYSQDTVNAIDHQRKVFSHTGPASDEAVDSLELYTVRSGTPGVGFGCALAFNPLESEANPTRIISEIADATVDHAYVDFVFHTMSDNTVAERCRIAGTALTLVDAYNFAVGTSTGTKIGTSTGQKLGFWNATPVVQPSTTGTTTGFTAGSGTAVNDDSTFTGNTGSKAYTIGDIVKALKDCGIMAAS